MVPTLNCDPRAGASDAVRRCPLCHGTHRVGFVATRLAGTDGVSLETEKWERVFEREGFTCYYFAGEIDRPKARSYLVEEAHFQHPDIRRIYNLCFGVTVRKPRVTKAIFHIKEIIKAHLYHFVRRHAIDMLVPENALTIPLNLPLGIAVTEFIAETGIPVIAHHHDFYWERQHFMTNAVWDYLNMAFPPNLPSIHHAVISSAGDNQLGLRTGISAHIIPNVMDFENPPPPVDVYAADVRRALGIKRDEIFVLQPTRVVKRKGIEHAIELVNRLGMKAKLVISHASGDEGFDYEKRVRNYSKIMGVDTLFVSRKINEQRKFTENGHKVYTLADVYPHADLITYPSNFEGFGNAFLEAIYYSKPIVVNNYSIYSTDIKPKGFKVIEIDGYVSERAVRQTREVLTHPDLRREMVAHNYRVATKHFSYKVLQRKLEVLIADTLMCMG